MKYTESDGKVIEVRCWSYSLTSGKVRAAKCYTAAMIDWLAVYDRTTGRCYYIPARELGEGRRRLYLRLTPPRNNRRAGIRFAENYLDLNSAVTA